MQGRQYVRWLLYKVCNKTDFKQFDHLGHIVLFGLLQSGYPADIWFNS